MTALRAGLLRHRALSSWLIALALLMRVLVPAGFMPVVSGSAVTLTLCSGHGAEMAAMPAMAQHDAAADHDRHDHGKQGHDGADAPCLGFGMALAALAAADPIVLTAAIAVPAATIFRPTLAAIVRHTAHLRPFSRGPPSAA